MVKKWVLMTFFRNCEKCTYYLCSEDLSRISAGFCVSKIGAVPTNINNKIFQGEGGFRKIQGVQLPTGIYFFLESLISGTVILCLCIYLLKILFYSFRRLARAYQQCEPSDLQHPIKEYLLLTFIIITTATIATI